MDNNSPIMNESYNPMEYNIDLNESQDPIEETDTKIDSNKSQDQVDQIDDIQEKFDEDERMQNIGNIILIDLHI
jgi:hypothetical protein